MDETYYFIEVDSTGEGDWNRHGSGSYDTQGSAASWLRGWLHATQDWKQKRDYRVVRRVLTDTVVEEFKA